MRMSNQNQDKGLSRLQSAFLLLPSIYALMCVGSTFALFEYFYQSVAASKGLPSYLYSIVYSVSKIAMLIGSLSAEVVMSRISNKFVFVVGLIGSIVCDLSMGAAYWLPDGWSFFGFSIFIMSCRLFMGAWFFVSLLATATSRYSTSIGLVVSLSEVLWGLAFTIGVSFGGLLIDVWNFALPYFTFATLALASVPYFMTFGPMHNSLGSRKIAQLLNQAHEESSKKVNYLYLLLNVRFMICMITIMFNFVTIGFNGPTLEAYLRKTFEFTPTTTGEMLMLQHGCYAAGSMLAGVVWQKGYANLAAFSAQLMGTIGFLIQGPTDFLPIEPSVTLIILAQVLLGFAGAGQMVCGFASALQTAINMGYPDNLKTSGIVSSWGFVSFIIGAVTTPLWAAACVSYFGYRSGTDFVFGLYAAWTLVIGVAWLFDSLYSRWGKYFC